jgi:hypothetical protein
MCVVFGLALQSKKRVGRTCLKWTDTFVLTGQKKRHTYVSYPTASREQVVQFSQSFANKKSVLTAGIFGTLQQSRRQPYLSQRTVHYLSPWP